MSLSQSCLLLAVSGDDAGSAELQQILHVPSQAFKSFNVLTHVHYVRVPLSQKTFCIAKLASAVGVSEIRSKSIPGNFKVFPARCCFSVTGGSEWDGKTTLVAATDIKILKKTSIKSVCVKVLLKSKNDVINMEKNTNLYLKVIENIISSYGIVSHCVIRCHYNTLAQVFGIRKIFICSMKSCNNQSSSCSNFNDSFDCVGVKFNDSSNTRQIELELKQGTSPCGCSESCFRANPERLQRSNGRVTVCSVAQEDQLSNSQTNYSINLHEAIMQQGLTVQDKSLEKLFIAQKTEGLLLLVIGLSGWGKTSLLHRVAMTARTPVVSIDCRTMKPNIDAIFQMKTQLPTERPGLLLLRRLDTLFAASKKPDHIINEIVGAILCYLQQKGVCVVVTAPDIGSLPPDLVALPYIELNVGSSTVPYRRAILRHFLADYNLADYKAGAHEMPADYAPKRSLVDSYPSQEHKLPGSCSLSTRRNSIEPELSYNMIGDDPSGSQQFEVDVDSIYSVTTRDASPKYDIKSGSPVDVITDSVRNLNLNDKDSEQMSSSKSMCSEVVALNPASSKERLTHQIQLAEGSIADQLARITPGYVASDIQDLLSLGQEKLLITGEEAISPADMMSAAVEELRTFRPRVLRSSELLGDRPVAHTLGGLEYLQELLSDILKITVSGADEDLSLLGVKPTRGVLLYGPPGCGKTQLICRLASSKGCAFFAIQPKHILSPYVGESEQKLSHVFQTARQARPAILFFDEIDGIFGDRGSGDGEAGGVRNRLITELLQTMDGALAYSDGSNLMTGLLVCGATNNPDRLDHALLRPGRFDRVVYVPPPDPEQRLHILMAKCQRLELNEPEVLEELAAETDLFTGSDLEGVVQEATTIALLQSSLTSDGNVLITASSLREICRKTKPKLTPEIISRYEAFQSRSTNT